MKMNNNPLKINPATAGKGINLLVDEGIIYKKRGVGMFVSMGAKEKILQKLIQMEFEFGERTIQFKILQ